MAAAAPQLPVALSLCLLQLDTHCGDLLEHGLLQLRLHAGDTGKSLSLQGERFRGTPSNTRAPRRHKRAAALLMLL